MQRPIQTAVMISWLAFALTPVIATGMPEQVTIEQLVREAWDQSPQIRGQQVQTSLASGDRWRRFLLNEPQLQFSSSDDHSAESYGLQVTTSFPGKSFAFRQVDDAKYTSQKLEILAKKFDLAKTISQSYLDCASARDLYELQKETSSDLETVFRTLKSLYESGHAAQAEKIGAELQSRQAKLDLVTAQDKTEILCRKLAAVLELHHPSETANSDISRLDLKLPTDISADFIDELGPRTSDQARAVGAGAVADATYGTAWWTQVPDPTFGVSRNHYIYLPASPSGKTWATTYSVSITLPLLFPFHETIEASRQKSQARIDLNAAQLLKLQADSDQLDAAKEYSRSRMRLEELRNKDLILGEALVESTYSAYRAGKLGYAELVQSRKTLNDLRTQDVQLRQSIVMAHLRCLNQCQVATTSTPKAARP